jgi:hypothetical protein
MKYRIAWWASVGFLVSACWAFYASTTLMNPGERITWILAQVTEPIVFAGVHFNFGLRLWWVLVANAATYAAAGLLVESVRRQLNRQRA